MTESSFMLEAFELAKKGQFTVQNGVCVGCIISKDNEILGQGWYEYYGAPHAEIRAIESIKEKYKEKKNNINKYKENLVLLNNNLQLKSLTINIKNMCI